MNLLSLFQDIRMNVLPKVDPFIRMQQDLKRAQNEKKAVRWGMVIDQSKCIGCHACVVACIAENALPEGVAYRSVTETEEGIYPHVSRQFLPRPCMQCAHPPCVPVCPVQATWREENNGVTVIDYAKCVGCRRCIKACPYGARVFDFGDDYASPCPSYPKVLVGSEGAQAGYSEVTAAEYNHDWGKRSKKAPVGKVRKCHFCLQRLQVGILPACVTSCIGRATVFGNLADKQSLVSELATSRRAWRLKEETGTKPHVIYWK